HKSQVPSSKKGRLTAPDTLSITQLRPQPPRKASLPRENKALLGLLTSNRPAFGQNFRLLLYFLVYIAACVHSRALCLIPAAEWRLFPCLIYMPPFRLRISLSLRVAHLPTCSR